MAEQALKKLEDQLYCFICLDTYTDPKQLQCNHVFCQQCLVRVVARDQQGQLTLTCPNCHQVSPVPASGVAGLQAAFQINQFLEIVEEHKKAITPPVSSEKAENAATVHSTTIGCPEHGGRGVELYCETCKKVICFRCIKKGEKHNNHDYKELDEAFERYKGEITSSLEPMAKQLETINRVLKELDTCRELIANQQATAEDKIHHTFEKLHEALDIRKTILIDQLHQRIQAKLMNLAVQRDQIETTQAQLSGCLHFMRENLKTGNQGKALMIKSTTLKRIKELTTTFQPNTLKPVAKVDITVLFTTDIVAAIQNCGQVYLSGQPDPAKCAVMGGVKQVLTVGEKLKVMLQTFDSHNQTATLDSISSITSELESEMTGSREKGGVEKKEQNLYEICHQLAVGRHQLHIKIEGQYIKGSPFLLVAKNNLYNLEIPHLIINDLESPGGIAVNRRRGEIFVAEKNKSCVTVFSPSGKKLRSFGTKGSGDGEFDSPYGVAVDGEGCIYVTDFLSCRVQKFTADYKFLAAVGSEGDGPLKFKNTKSIAYNPRNNRVYVGDSNGGIQVLNSDLSYVTSFGKDHSEQGRGCRPAGLEFDSAGNIFVADDYKHCVQVYTAEGQWLRKFEGRGENIKPDDVSIDSQDRVYVSDKESSRIFVFTSNGQLLKVFGEEGSGPGQFIHPSGLTVDSNGVVYICDYNNERVQIFY